MKPFKLDSDDDQPIDLTTPKLPFKRRSSFFNIVSKDKGNKVDNKTLKREKYIEELNKEKEDWYAIVQKSNVKVRELAQTLQKKAVPVDFSILSKERRMYLEQGIDFKSYLEQYESFSRDALYYVKEKEWLQQRLSYCNEQLEDEIIERKIQLISNQKKNT